MSSELDKHAHIHTHTQITNDEQMAKISVSRKTSSKHRKETLCTNTKSKEDIRQVTGN